MSGRNSRPADAIQRLRLRAGHLGKFRVRALLNQAVLRFYEHALGPTLPLRMRRTDSHRAKFYERPTYVAIIGRIAANVRRLREERGWSQAELAFRADEMEVVALQGIERGASNATVVTIARLCDAFGVDVRELMQPAAPPPKRPRGRPRKNA